MSGYLAVFKFFEHCIYLQWFLQSSNHRGDKQFHFLTLIISTMSHSSVFPLVLHLTFLLFSSSVSVVSLGNGQERAEVLPNRRSTVEPHLGLNLNFDLISSFQSNPQNDKDCDLIISSTQVYLPSVLPPLSVLSSPSMAALPMSTPRSSLPGVAVSRQRQMK
jgi:hypothetical protein